MCVGYYVASCVYTDFLHDVWYESVYKIQSVYACDGVCELVCLHVCV